MSATLSNNPIADAGIQELARRSGNGVDVALLWESGRDQVFVVVDDELTGERFRIDVGSRSALDVFHHPYAYRDQGEQEQHGGLATVSRAA